MVRPVPPGRSRAGHRELAPGARTFARRPCTSRPARPWPTSWAPMATSVEPLVPGQDSASILLPSSSRVRARATQDPPGARHGRRRGRDGGGRAAVPGGRRAVHVRGRPVGDVDGERSAGNALVDPAGAHVTRRRRRWSGWTPPRSALRTSGTLPEPGSVPADGADGPRARVREHHRVEASASSTLEMPADGQPLAFTAQEPRGVGAWRPASCDQPPYQLSAEAVGATGWRAVARTPTLRAVPQRRSATRAPARR